MTRRDTQGVTTHDQKRHTGPPYTWPDQTHRASRHTTRTDTQGLHTHDQNRHTGPPYTRPEQTHRASRHTTRTDTQGVTTHGEPGRAETEKTSAHTKFSHPVKWKAWAKQKWNWVHFHKLITGVRTQNLFQIIFLFEHYWLSYSNTEWENNQGDYIPV